MTLDLVTPYKKVRLDLPVSEVTLPAANGEIQILPKHASLVSTLKTGVLKFHSQADNKMYVAAISYGFVEVQNDHVTVLANTLELASEVDVARAEKAYQLASEKLKSNLDEDGFRKYQFKLERSLIRLQAAKHS